MTVKELMSYLQSLPPEEEVTVRDRQGKEMHVQDITKKVKQIVPIRSKTPTKSVNSVMQKTDEIRRVGPGTFKYVGK